jgi:hypothetical protein
LSLGSAEWTPLIIDDKNRVAAAKRTLGRGTLTISSRGLLGDNPDFPDAINVEFWRPLIERLASVKPLPHTRSVNSLPAENAVHHCGMIVRSSSYMSDYVDVVAGLFHRTYPVLKSILGVDPSPGQLTELELLPTGGGGFSGGKRVGVGTFWGDFPDSQYGMIELIGHEATHSWVLPHAEPLWNEGIATFVGIKAAALLGHKSEADRVMSEWISKANQHDPQFKNGDLSRLDTVPHDVQMGKPMWIWSELEKERDDALARYFQTKRRLISSNAPSYSAADSIAVLSIAMERNLFPWFNSHGISVLAESTPLFSLI